MRELWINIVTDDVHKAVSFYLELGFTLNPHFPVSEEGASFYFNESKLVLMLFHRSFFDGKIPSPLITHPNQHEVLLSIGATSKEDADHLVETAIRLGGKALGTPVWSGNMYNTGFIDLDGHHWNILFYQNN